MKTLQKVVTAITLAAVLICMTASIKAKADTIEASEVLAAIVPGGDLTSIAYAYTSLNDDQRLIADYLMGAYNYTYLCARGFSFNIDQTETNMKATLGAVGERIFQYITTEYAWRSRFNEVFRQYASSIIVYASKQTVIFDTWINDILSGTRNVYIEYTEDAFDAWTEFYNDPSGDGIALFGDVISPWNSGIMYDYAFVGIQYDSNDDQQLYNNFVLNYSPVVYTNTGNIASYLTAQFILHLDSIPTCLYVKRGDTFTTYRYGYNDFQLHNLSYKYLLLRFNSSTNKVKVTGVNNGNTNLPIETYNNATSLDDLVQYAFAKTPITLNTSNEWIFTPTNWYYFIEHVYLVDDLNTLSNPEEIFDTSSFNIVPPQNPQFIITPNGKMLIPGYAPMTDPFAELWDVSVDVDGDTVTEDDFNTQIVNNTVINNYTIDASDKINVPVDWFDNELSDQLANDSIPFLSFARDCIDCLGDLQIYFYGAIVFGLGGGVLKKLLL